VRVGLFGGSFDPIHAGHVAVARAATSALALDRVLFLPTARPPHKRERRFAPPLARFAMAELALLDEPDFWVSSLELEERPVYTVETLAAFASQAPESERVLLVGADSLAGFESWRSWREILAGAELGVVTRPGSERDAVEARMSAELHEAVSAARLTWIEGVAHPASASEIRRRLATGEALPEGWLDPRVLSFVAKYRLYR